MIKLIALSLLSGILYRLGGKAGFNTKIRDFGVAACVAAYLFTPGSTASYVVLFLTFGTMFAVLTVGYGGEGEPEYDQSALYRWFKEAAPAVLGFVYGFGILPYFIYNLSMLFFVRCFVLAALIFLTFEIRWRWWKFESDDIQEFLRGAIIILTLVLIKGV